MLAAKDQLLMALIEQIGPTCAEIERVFLTCGCSPGLSKELTIHIMKPALTHAFEEDE
jgi:hypothetical protein